MKKTLAIVVLGALILGSWGAPAEAGRWYWSVTLGSNYVVPAPYYYAPAPVVYPQTVYYPQPTYYPPTVYYAPPVVYRRPVVYYPARRYYWPSFSFAWSGHSRHHHSSRSWRPSRSSHYRPVYRGHSVSHGSRRGSSRGHRR